MSPESYSPNNEPLNPKPETEQALTHRPATLVRKPLPRTPWLGYFSGDGFWYPGGVFLWEGVCVGSLPKPRTHSRIALPSWYEPLPLDEGVARREAVPSSARVKSGTSSI